MYIETFSLLLALHSSFPPRLRDNTKSQYLCSKCLVDEASKNHPGASLCSAVACVQRRRAVVDGAGASCMTSSLPLNKQSNWNACVRESPEFMKYRRKLYDYVVWVLWVGLMSHSYKNYWFALEFFTSTLLFPGGCQKKAALPDESRKRGGSKWKHFNLMGEGKQIANTGMIGNCVEKPSLLKYKRCECSRHGCVGAL